MNSTWQKTNLPEYYDDELIVHYDHCWYVEKWLRKSRPYPPVQKHPQNFEGCFTCPGCVIEAWVKFLAENQSNK